MSKEDINKLERWLKRRPENATVLRCSARSLGQLQVVRELVSDTSANDYHDIAVTLFEDCSDWADTKEKEVRFLIQWLENDRPIATREMVISPLNSDGLPPIDGSLESLVASLHATGLQKDQMLINMTKAMVEIVIRVSEAFQGRMDHVHVQEQENLKLREALIETAATDDEWKKEVVGLIKGFLPGMISKNPGA